MSPVRRRLRTGLLLSSAVLWVFAGVGSLLVAAMSGTPRLAQAQSAPAQNGPATAVPAAGDAAQHAEEKNMSTPEARAAGVAHDAKPAGTPGAGSADAAAPQAKPVPAVDPASASMKSAASRPSTQMTPARQISWGTDYRSYAKVTGYINSLEHGNRLGVTYVSPPAAATIYRQNAALVRDNKSSGFSTYPVGTVIVMETWLKNANGAPDSQGPIFLLRKERGGFDTEGRDWFYGFTDAKLHLIAEGRDGKVTFCRGCHVSVANRDAVFAMDR